MPIGGAAHTDLVSNALSFDVEDWFQVSAFAPYIDRQTWGDLPCRVERNVDLLLELLNRRQVKATFFTLEIGRASCRERV